MLGRAVLVVGSAQVFCMVVHVEGPGSWQIVDYNLHVMFALKGTSAFVHNSVLYMPTT